MMMDTNAIIIIVIITIIVHRFPLSLNPHLHTNFLSWTDPHTAYHRFSIFVLSFLIPTIVGPAVEAFGYQRIIFGSSPVSSEPSNAGDWYEIARESVAELGLEQEDIDAIFYSNAQSVYGLSSSA